MISHKDIEQIALLSRLELTGEEKETYSRQLNNILGHFEPLGLVDTKNVTPMIHVLPLKNVFRKDQVGEQMSRDEALSNCPASEDGYFKVPRII